MDTRDLNDLGLTSDAARIIGGYLTELASHLPAGRRTRKEIVAEVADGLLCAVEEYRARGASAAVAAGAAVAEFGDPLALATAFARQLGPMTAHRVGLGLVLTGPLVGLTWVAAYATAGLGWRSQVAVVLSATPLPLILAATVPAAMIAITGAGWASRRLTLPPRLVTGAAVLAAIGCVAGDLSLLAAAVLGHLPSGAASVGLIVAAVVASVVRLSAAGWAGLRVARLRAGAR